MLDIDRAILETSSLTEIQVSKLSEEDKAEMADKLVTKLYKSVQRKAKDIDIPQIENSRGDITKMAGYKDLRDALKFLGQIADKTPANAELKEVVLDLENGIQFLINYKEYFVKGFSKNNAILRNCYIATAGMVVQLTAYCISKGVVFENNGVMFEAKARKMVALKHHMGYKHLKEILELARKNKLDKNFKDCLALSEATITLGWIGVSLLLLTSIRGICHLFLSTRVKMAEYFDTPQQADAFIAENFERKERNLICRRIRMSRKANQQKWNYFVTFTYDDALHTEDSFRESLMNRLSLFSSRKKWRYIGVWERSPEKKRLHFHGIFFIPDGTMPGELVEVSDYSFSSKKRQTTAQNTCFNTYFGRSDFEEIDEHLTARALQYMLKYIEKTGERIVYSRGLYQYFISDIMDDDIVFVTGTDENKFVLFDDFSCSDEGVYIGQNSLEVRAQMRKSN